MSWSKNEDMNDTFDDVVTQGFLHHQAILSDGMMPSHILAFTFTTVFRLWHHEFNNKHAYSFPITYSIA